MDSTDQSTIPLLVHISDDEVHTSAYNFVGDLGFGTMESPGSAAHERTVNDQGNSRLETNNNGASGVDGHGVVVDNTVVEQELAALEQTQKWYSYLSSTDFLIVLALGYVGSHS